MCWVITIQGVFKDFLGNQGVSRAGWDWEITTFIFIEHKRTVYHIIYAEKRGVKRGGALILACVASIFVLFRSKERPRNEILGFGRARNETRAKKWKRGEGRGILSSQPPPRLLASFFTRSLLGNSTEMLATQATLIQRGLLFLIYFSSREC